MCEFWVFHCPPGEDREAAVRGDIVCFCTTVYAECVTRVREDYPDAVCIHRVQGDH